MGRRSRVAIGGAAGVLGAATAVFAASGGGVPACVGKKTGAVREAGPTGKCGPGEFGITISGEAKGKGGTLTINGVAFKKGSGKTITINGTAFKKGRGKTITINGTAFRTGTLRNTLTINGTAFRTGTLPNTLTINGVAFKKGSGGTLTINGTAFGPGTAGAKGDPGPKGDAGAQGPPGPAGSFVTGPAPTEVAGPFLVTPGAAAATVASVQITTSDGKAHRVLLTGGFSVTCNPCGSSTVVRPIWALRRPTAPAEVSRRLSPMLDSSNNEGSASVNEVLVTPTICGPCTYELALSATGGSATPTLDVTSIRLAIVDLGVVSS